MILKNRSNKHAPVQTKERSFNNIQFYEDSVKKTIFDLQKGKQELFFYQNLDKEQERYFPRILNFKTKKSFVRYEMEKINTFDLSVFYLNEQLTTLRLQQLFKCLDQYWNHIPRQVISNKKWSQIAQSTIVDKLNLRWSQYQQTDIYHTVSSHLLNKYGLKLSSFKKKMEIKLIQQLQQQNENTLYATHGDMCFSNIFLISPKKIKMIDPRGAQCKKDLYIPLAYDLAKLSQCIYGNYDGILVDKEINFNKQQLLFKKWVMEKQIDLQLIRLIESSLLLSLLPLHLDRPESHIKLVESSILAFELSS